MGQESKIQWTDATVNFWTGCSKVSPGCKNCYMFSGQERWGKNPSIVVRTNPKTFNAALSWKEPKKIFTCSWSDFFHEGADDWREDAWDIIRKTPLHTWIILTKRPERIRECLPSDWGEGYENVWLGTTVENQEMANERIAKLCLIPSKIKFLSVEPILEDIDLTNIQSKEFDNFNCLPFINWVIVGGESGNKSGKYKYRSSEIDWYRIIVRDCKRFNVPVFVKQLGSHLASEMKLKDKKGGDIEDFPEELQIREFPDVKFYL